jgi:hypothetical protein
MNRRQLLHSLAYLSAHTMFPAILTGFLASCTNTDKADHSYEFFTAAEIETIKEMIDIILPATKTKAASEVNTHLFLDQVFAKCMTPEQQEVIRTGLAQVAPGLSSATDKIKYLGEIDKKAYANDEAAVYFKTIKQYAMIGFFTSQEGTTKASNYVKIPDGYHGEIPVTEDTLNYGKTSLKFYM